MPLNTVHVCRHVSSHVSSHVTACRSRSRGKMPEKKAPRCTSADQARSWLLAEPLLAPKRAVMPPLIGPDPPSSLAGDVWPPLPLESWRNTRDTLHMYTQIVGKVRL